MTARATSAQKIAVGMLMAGGVLVIASEAAVVWQFSQMVPYTNAPPPDTTLYERTMHLGGALVVGAMAIILYQAWRTHGLAGMWNIIRPKTRIQKFGCGVFFVGLIMAALNIGGKSFYSVYGLIVMMVGSSLWQRLPAIKKDPANS